MKVYKTKFLLEKLVFAGCLLLIGFVVKAQELELQVEGMATFDAASFSIENAGADFNASVESESTLFVTVDSNDAWDKTNNPNRKWKVEVRKEDVSWDDAMQVEIVRSGNGYSKENNKSNHVNDGQNYQVVSANSSYFFRGKGLISEIPIQFRLSGISIVHGAGDFETNVMLTIYDD
ncbi:hypothetical protein [Maribellus sediminis]|uniref:hypothetical protein n=1 Tax=Maribellus sediminis TaxID=2696285 RepID=UPI001430F0C2|nr:hypothetical protein [Maribellus sediminis]